MLEAIEEHHIVKWVLSELERLSPSTPPGNLVAAPVAKVVDKLHGK